MSSVVYQQYILLHVFVLVCSDHYYGIDCKTPCGHCKNNGVCDKGTGSCPNECQNHWQGVRCDSKCEDCKNPNCKDLYKELSMVLHLNNGVSVITSYINACIKHITFHLTAPV